MSEQHYESYRKSLLGDSLEGVEEYARTVETKNPKHFPTIYDYLSELVKSIRNALEQGSSHDYMDLVNKHRYAMLQLFERMVEERLWGYEGATEDTYMKMINQWGYNWFKFSRIIGENNNASLRFLFKNSDPVEEVLLIPRYKDNHLKSMPHGDIYIDSDELRDLNVIRNKRKDFDKFLKRVLEEKRKTPCLKIVIPAKPNFDEDPRSYLCKLSMLNSWLAVQEWTLPLM